MHIDAEDKRSILANSTRVEEKRVKDILITRKFSTFELFLSSELAGNGKSVSRKSCIINGNMFRPVDSPA